MFLSKVVLNTRHRDTYRLLADVYAQHRFVMTAFPELAKPLVNGQGPQRQLNVLYRLEAPSDSHVYLLVQSAEEPDWTKTINLHPGIIRESPHKADSRSYEQGEQLRFRLRANPTVCKVNRDADGRRNPKREGLVKEADQLAWLVRTAQRAGFAINPEAVLVTPRGKQGGVKPTLETSGRTNSITALAVDFDGRLVVTDLEIFAQSLSEGIGRGKAWGCGLLSVTRG